MFFTQAFIPESYELLFAKGRSSGLFPVESLPVKTFDSGVKHQQRRMFSIETYSCGTAPDLHRIPF